MSGDIHSHDAILGKTEIPGMEAWEIPGFMSLPRRSRSMSRQWRGPLTKELSEIKAEADFPLSEEGLAEMTAWLEARSAEINA
ncbi:MAG: hypothetical protein ACLR1K_02235 [Oscillospiraceae bacterium]